MIFASSLSLSLSLTHTHRDIPHIYNINKHVKDSLSRKHVLQVLQESLNAMEPSHTRKSFLSFVPETAGGVVDCVSVEGECSDGLIPLPVRM